MQPYLGVGTMNIYTGLSNKYADKAISVINEQLQKFAKEGISGNISALEIIVTTVRTAVFQVQEWLKESIKMKSVQEK